MKITPQQKYWLQCGIRWDHVDADFENYDTDDQGRTDAKEAMLEFCRGVGTFAVLSGDYGTGKSHLAVAALKQFGSGVFATNAELLNLLRALPFNGPRQSDGEEKAITKGSLVDTLKECLLLVIDELASCAGGVDESTLLDDVLSFRAACQYPTVFTTNAGLPQVEAFLGGRLMDRINQSALIVPAVKGSRRHAAAKLRTVGIPSFRFNGSLPVKPSEDQALLWREWLQSTGQDKPEWREIRFAPDFLKSDFRRWLANPERSDA